MRVQTTRYGICTLTARRPLTEEQQAEMMRALDAGDGRVCFQIALVAKFGPGDFPSGLLERLGALPRSFSSDGLCC
jgi:hypothetical protein